MEAKYLYILAFICLAYLSSKPLRILLYNIVGQYVGPIKRVAVIGHNPTADRLVAYLNGKKNIHFYGWLDHEQDMFCEEGEQLSERLLQQISKAAKSQVKTLYISIEPARMANINALVRAAENQFLRIKVIPDLGLIGLYNMSYIDGQFASVSLRAEPLDELGNRIKKRIMDVLISGMVIVFLLSWLYPLIGILIKLQSKGPVLFRQLRSGRDDQPFYCLKFRSMMLNEESDSLQATKSDNRITEIGKFLRRTSLDELPQFFNVFLGDMSVVGPRPHMLSHTSQYKDLINQFMVRHFLKPGITGWAQVNGSRGETRHKEDMERRVQHDIWYLENWSGMLDLKIFFLTIISVMKGDENAF